MKYVIVDYRIKKEEINTLEKLSYEILICPSNPLIQTPVCGHPDMLINIINKNTIMVCNGMDLSFISKLQNLGYKIIFSKDKLSYSYPKDIILNAVNLENVFIHNIKFTDEELLKSVSNKRILNVKQGYTKCSTAVISQNAFITSDVNICTVLSSAGFDVLFVPPGDIELPGYNYGFIGGCCGILEDGLIGFYGSLKYYSYGSVVMEFLKKHNVEAVFLRDGKLVDRGTLFTI